MRVLVGGLFLLLGASALQAQDSVIVIDPDAPPGDSAVVRGGPPPGVVTEKSMPTIGLREPTMRVSS